MAGWSTLPVAGAVLEVKEYGTGEPVVVVPTALDADELREVARLTAEGGSFRVIHYHRRGYAGSSPARAATSVADEATDCRWLMDALQLGPAHVLGASYSGAIALTLASTVPDRVRTLTVVEPPPVHVPRAGEFRAANDALTETFRTHGPLPALDEFQGLVLGPDWRRLCEQERPGSVAAMERDAGTFFGTDLPALLSWRFGALDAARVSCPVLYVGGSDSGPWFAEVRAWLQGLLPQLEDATVEGAGHLLASTHPSDLARLAVDFLARHR